MANPKGSETVSSVVEEPLADHIQGLAEASNMSRSRYVAELMREAVRERRVFRVTAGVLKETPPPYRTKNTK